MSHLITGSLVLYNTLQDDIKNVVDDFFNSDGDYTRFLFLIDNSDKEHPQTYLENKNIKYIKLKKNLGFGKAHNVAMKKAIEMKSDYHILINPDIRYEKKVISELKNYMDKNLDVGNVIPKVLYPNGEIQRLGRLLPNPIILFFRLLRLDYFNDLYEIKSYDYDKIITVPYTSGCFMFLRTSILHSVGFFDNRFFMYAEDLDFSRRIASKYFNRIYPYCEITHRHKKESFKNIKLMLIHIKSIICYFNKWGWIIDKERRKLNKLTLHEISSNPGS